MINDRDGMVAGVALLLIGLLTVIVLIPYGIDEPSNVRLAVLAPSFYPRIVSIGIMLIGVAVIIRAATTPPAEEGPGLPSTRAAVKVGTAVLILFLTALTLPYAGFILSSAVALIALMLLADERNPLVISTVALALPVSLHLFFTKIANVPIPEGILEPILRGV